MKIEEIKERLRLFLFAVGPRRIIRFSSVFKSKLKLLLRVSHASQPSPSPVQSSPVNCCWPLPAQSLMVSGIVGTRDIIYVRSKIVYIFGHGVSSSMKGGFCRSE
jgi:hypothetical protein